MNARASDPLVSLIVAAVEPLETLPTAIASIIDQTWHRIEPIVVVPSQKQSAEMQNVLRQHTDELRIVEAPADSKLADLFAVGLASATGDYVAWLTSHDSCDPRRIERQLDVLGRDGGPLIACSGPSPTVPASAARETTQDPGSDLPWALLDGRIDPRTFLAPRHVLEAVQGFASAFEHLFEYDIGLRLTSRSQLVVDSLPMLYRGSALKPPGRRSEVQAEFDRLWKTAVDSVCGSEPVRDEAGKTALQRQLGRAYAISRELGSAPAAQYVLDSAVKQAVTEPVTVVRLMNGSAADGDVRRTETGAAGETILGLDGADEAGWVFQLQRAIEAVNSPWVIIAGNGSHVSPSMLAAQLLAAVDGDYDATLPVSDPVVFDSPQDTSLIPGTLFRVSALGATAWSLCAGEPQFWNAFAHAGRIGALPEVPCSRLATPLVAALIDADWYRTAYPDVRDCGIDPVEHYLSYGWREGRDPNAWFATQWYLEQNPDASERDEPALQHFVRQGARAGRRPHPEFDIVWYSRHYLGLEHPSPEALHHFLTTGLAAGARPGAAEAPTGDALAVALVDAAWYLTTYPDVAAAGLDPAQHYLNYGWREGRNPNAWFATQWYLEQNPEVKQNGGSPLLHFVQQGAGAGQCPHPDFDIAWYSRQYLGSDHPVPEALYHFLTTGRAAGATANPMAQPSIEDMAIALVDADWYRTAYPDVAASGLDPAQHYLNYGWREGRDPNPWFATRWYLEQNPDVKQSGDSPLLHFVRHGARAGRNPHPEFDIVWYSRQYLSTDQPGPEALHHFLTEGVAAGAKAAAVVGSNSDELTVALVDPDWYRIANPDVADAGLNPVEHYLNYGWREGRDPNAWFSTRWYLDHNPALKEAGEPPLPHFVQQGAKAGRRPHPDFDVAWYSQQYLGLDHPSPEALRHFLNVGLAAGAAPNPVLNGRHMGGRAAAHECGDRTSFLKRLLLLMRDAKPAKPWRQSDADLWPLLLANAGPDEGIPVLVLSDKASDPGRRLARLLASALPYHEFALFAETDDSGRLTIYDRLVDAEAAVVLQLPEQISALRQLAEALRVGRAVMTDEALHDTVHARWLRDAGIPVSVNGAKDVQS